MAKTRTRLILPLILLLAACGQSSNSELEDADGGSKAEDAAVRADAALVADAAVRADAALVADAALAADAAPLDAAPHDAAAPLDALIPDAAPGDAVPADAAPVDATVLDAAALPDAEVTPDAEAAPDAAPPDTGPIDAGFTEQTIVDETGTPRTIVNAPPGIPEVVGCSDGQREGFVDDGVYPNTAGCLGTWSGTLSLRTSSTAAACGDDLDACATPADLCAPGWHICGTSGLVEEVRQIGASDCANAGGGRYVTAISHCLTQSGCAYDTTPTAVYSCFPSGWCSEPVCCGQACPGFGACPSGVWPNATHIPVGTDQGCGAMSSRRAGGVICCRGP